MAFQGDSIFWVEVEKIVANPYQPRREFDETKLQELAESVRMYGILQPLTVTRKEVQNPDGSFRSEYELIAGERRLRASKLAGLSQVPVIIRDGEQTEQEKLELAIIENLQREDLNAVDRALAFRQLADVFGLSHSQVAKKVGRSREYVSNSIRLLALPDYMLDSLKLGDISEGHARTLLMLNDRPEEQDTVFREILLKKLSVRDVERIARGIATEKVRKKESIDNELLALEQQFTETLGTRVSIVKTDFGGRLTIDYFSPEDLQLMLDKMRADAAAAPALSPTTALAALTTATALTVTSETEAAGDTEAEEEEPREAESEEVVSASPAVSVEDAGIHNEPAVAESESVPSPEAPSEPILISPTVPVITPHIPLHGAERVVSQAAEHPVESVDTPTPVSHMHTEVPFATPASQEQNSLRQQLESLLQATQAQPNNISQVTEVTPSPSAPPTAKPPVESSDDDSDLYSLRNFTV